MSLSMWVELLGCDFRQHTVDAGGIRTRLLEAGSGEPLILLHGSGGHAETYLRNFGRLSKHFRVVAYDMIGHGFTDKPDRPYTLDLYSGHLLDLLDALGIERANLSGESLGGWVAGWFAAERPERVSKLVLNTPGNILNKPEVMERMKATSLRAVESASRETVRERLSWLFYERNRHLVTDELVEVRYRIYTQPGFVQAMRNILVLQDIEVRRRYAWDPSWVGRIQAPTLLLWTSHDPTGSIEEANVLKEWLPGARLHVIEGAGHWPQWEKPEEFEELHREFLLGDDDHRR